MKGFFYLIKFLIQFSCSIIQLTKNHFIHIQCIYNNRNLQFGAHPPIFPSFFWWLKMIPTFFLKCWLPQFSCFCKISELKLFITYFLLFIYVIQYNWFTYISSLLILSSLIPVSTEYILLPVGTKKGVNIAKLCPSHLFPSPFAISQGRERKKLLPRQAFSKQVPLTNAQTQISYLRPEP